MSDKMLKLYIEPTSRCNFNCAMCFRKTWFDEKYEDMPWSVFQEAMDTMPCTVNTVFFGGMGEPLIHKQIVKMVEYAHNKGKTTELITNGALLTKDISSQLMNAGLDMLWVSIDSFTETEYDKIQQNGKLSVIMDNLNELNRMRMKINPHENRLMLKPDLGLTFVAMKDNVQYLSRLTDFAQRFHVQQVNISNVLPSDEESAKQILYEDLVSNGMRREGNESGFAKINLPMMDFDNPQAQTALLSLMSSHFCQLSISDVPVVRKTNYCTFVQEGNCFVRYDGDVTPCMGVLHNSVTYLWQQKRKIYHYAFSNVSRQPLDDIWNSDEYVQFRKRVKEFSFSPCMYCGGCSLREDNREDCYGNTEPTCGACLWAEGVIRCP